MYPKPPPSPKTNKQKKHLNFFVDHTVMPKTHTETFYLHDLQHENTDANFSLKSGILQTVRTFLNAI
jgi:hypothetical protein